MNSALLNQTDTYTDFAGLNALKAQARTDESAALKEVAKQFESMFVSMMLKSMRDANKPFEEGNFLKSNQSDFYRDMFDSQLALSMTKGKGLGLAESLYRQLSAQAGLDSPAVTALGGKNIQDYSRDLPPAVQQMVEVVNTVDDLIMQSQAIQNQETRSQDTRKQATQTEATAFPAATADDAITAEPLEDFQESSNKPAPERFNSPQDFVDYLYPVAKKVEQQTGVDARFLLAQSALETGWGKHMINEDGKSASFNLFGIKADNRWQGEQVNITTTEYREGVAMKEKATFRSYSGYEESFRDYVDFIKSNDRYSEAVKVMDNPEKFVEELHKAGYATDPNYSQKVQRIFNSDLLQSALDTRLNQG